MVGAKENSLSLAHSVSKWVNFGLHKMHPPPIAKTIPIDGAILQRRSSRPRFGLVGHENAEVEGGVKSHLSKR